MTESDNAVSDGTHYGLSVDQSAQLDHDVDEMRAKAAEISMLVAAAFGGTTDVAIRACEVDGALQRLQWALKRQREAPPSEGLSNVSDYLAGIRTSKAAMA